jgi:hypothetical protein
MVRGSQVYDPPGRTLGALRRDDTRYSSQSRGNRAQGISDHVALVRYCSSQWRYTAFECGRLVPRQI